MLFRDGINQILVGVSINPMTVLVQFSGTLLISVVGSKIEDTFLLLDQRLRIHFCCWIKDWGYISVVGSKIEDTFLLLDQRLGIHICCWIKD